MQLKLSVLNFPKIPMNIREKDGKGHIFDPCRKKHVLLTPEEWVRQHCIYYLNIDKKVPFSMISVEKALLLNGQLFRYDLVVYSKIGMPILLVECKAPEVKITSSTFDQIAVYNLKLMVPYLFVTNGLEHYCCKVDFEKSSLNFIVELPSYNSL